MAQPIGSSTSIDLTKVNSLIAQVGKHDPSAASRLQAQVQSGVSSEKLAGVYREAAGILKSYSKVDSNAALQKSAGRFAAPQKFDEVGLGFVAAVGSGSGDRGAHFSMLSPLMPPTATNLV